ncbi:hypothetical protein T10_811 [Trichinella papuae]|uniref:Uncharacterized protein n=1 Tax=Trichinella papuae TaxID=268474 RepID=A0A0V1N0M8_9BILA|nr:hypothetical protein T10_811 [Trichinella papuae]
MKFQIKILRSEPMLNRQFTIVEFPLTAYAAVTNGLEEDGPTDTKHVRILFSVVGSRADNERIQVPVDCPSCTGSVVIFRERQCQYCTAHSYANDSVAQRIQMQMSSILPIAAPGMCFPAKIVMSLNRGQPPDITASLKYIKYTVVVL